MTSPVQIHDFNPGNAPNGLFWTIRIPDQSVNVDFDNATASYSLNNLSIGDYHDITSFLKGGPAIPSEVSFQMHWQGVQKRVEFRDKKKRFVGTYIDDKATIAWSAERPGFKFDSDPANTSITNFAQLGKESNGVFFS